MKKETFVKLYEEALKRAEYDKSMFDEVEVVLVPVVLGKSKGKVGSVSGVEVSIIFENENDLE